MASWEVNRDNIFDSDFFTSNPEALFPDDMMIISSVNMTSELKAETPETNTLS